VSIGPLDLTAFAFNIGADDAYLITGPDAAFQAIAGNFRGFSVYCGRFSLISGRFALVVSGHGASVAVHWRAGPDRGGSERSRSVGIALFHELCGVFRAICAHFPLIFVVTGRFSRLRAFA
jgi:hypothetical protein